jgi:hypothetical protein
MRRPSRARILGTIAAVMVAAFDRSIELGAALVACVIVAALFLPFVARAIERRRAQTAGDGPMAPFH